MLSMSLTALACLMASAGLALWMMPRLLQRLLDRWPGKQAGFDSRKGIAARFSHVTVPFVLVVSIFFASFLRFGDPFALLRVAFSPPVP